MLMLLHTGKVVAQLGARNQASSVSFGTNQAVETNRDFGSTMKPLTDYAPALENGVYTSTADTVYDGPYNFPGTTDPVHNWDPQLLFSNAISSNTTESNQHYGASSEKMAAAYAAFANGGTYYAPQYVNKIVYTDGTTTDFTTEGKRVMTEETAYMMTDMLKSVMTYGNGLNGAVDGVPQAGKTGTSNYTDPEIERILQENEAANSSLMVVPDENFVGYSTKYAMAVWTGYTNRSTPVLDDGMLVATDVYRNMMAYLNPIETATDWEIPDGLVQSGNYLYLKGFAPQYSYNYNTPASSSQSTTQSSSTTTGSTATETSTTTQATPNQTNTQTSTEQSTTNSSSAQTPATGQ